MGREARTDLDFDEAFNVVKYALGLAMDHTVEEIQTFGATYVPSPPWVTVVPTLITADVCALAAKVLIEHFGDEECRQVLGAFSFFTPFLPFLFIVWNVGGKEWWQRRARKDGGVPGEWIAMKRDYRPKDFRSAKPTSSSRPTTASSSRRSESQTSMPEEEDEGIAQEGYFRSFKQKDYGTEGGDGGERAKEEEIKYTAEMDETPRTMLYIHVNPSPFSLGLLTYEMVG